MKTRWEVTRASCGCVLYSDVKHSAITFLGCGTSEHFTLDKEGSGLPVVPEEAPIVVTARDEAIDPATYVEHHHENEVVETPTPDEWEEIEAELYPPLSSIPGC